jgi:hypothetical protein
VAQSVTPNTFFYRNQYETFAKEKNNPKLGTILIFFKNVTLGNNRTNGEKSSNLVTLVVRATPGDNGAIDCKSNVSEATGGGQCYDLRKCALNICAKVFAIFFQKKGFCNFVLRQ